MLQNSIHFHSSLNIPFTISLVLIIMTLRFRLISFVVVFILRSSSHLVIYFAFTLLTFFLLLITLLTFFLLLVTHNLQEHKSKMKANTFRQDTLYKHYWSPDGMTTTSHMTHSQHFPPPNPDFPISLASGCWKPGLPPQQTAKLTPPETSSSTPPPDTGGRGGHTWQVHCEFVESF